MKPENRDIRDYVDDMIAYSSDIQTFVGTMTAEEFYADRKTHFAVIRCLEVIGEAAKMIPDKYRKSAPELPWKQIAGTRDRLIHNYMGVDLFLVWNIVEHEIPRMIQHLQAFRNQFP
jgi:uncharacterized protein with HEPN domain